MNDLISVIIPVYNVAAYLPECLESVLKQDHENLEVILIDDGSKDDSGIICDRYAARDSRVRVIHQENGGAAAAKNAGLRIASGEYLSFVDSDDYLEPNVYGYMLQVLQTSGADAAQFAFRDVYRNRTEDQIEHRGGSVLTGEEYLIRFTKDWTCALLWNKLYKRKLFDGVFFEEGHKIDDEYFTYRGFLGDCRIVYDDRIVYNYRKRASGVMSSAQAGEKRILDCLDAIVKRRNLVLEHHPRLRREFDENYLDALYYLSGNEDSTVKTVTELKRHLKAYLKEKGNTFPPRYLWPMLAKLYFVDPEKRAAVCQAKPRVVDKDVYFA